jgi:hypothetical protein
VSGDNHAEPRRRGLHVELFQIVQNMNVDTLELEGQRVRELRRPGVLVVVPAYGIDRGNLAKGLDDLRSSDIAGVNDVLYAG